MLPPNKNAIENNKHSFNKGRLISKKLSDNNNRIKSYAPHFTNRF